MNPKNFPISENALLFLAPKNKNKQFSFLFLSFLPPSSQGISCNTPAPAPAPAAMMTEEKFWEAAVCGRFGELKEILCHVLCCLCVPCLNTLLLPHPFPPSHKTPSGARHLGARQKLCFQGTTALHQACYFGDASIVSLLLKHPGINVNKQDRDMWSPLAWACDFGSASCVRLLVKDKRVFIDVVKWWIASGREVPEKRSLNATTDFITDAMEQHYFEIAALLKMFKTDPAKIRRATRVQQGGQV